MLSILKKQKQKYGKILRVHLEILADKTSLTFHDDVRILRNVILTDAVSVNKITILVAVICIPKLCRKLLNKQICQNLHYHSHKQIWLNYKSTGSLAGKLTTH